MLGARLIYILAVIAYVYSTPVQKVFEVEAKPKQLQGRFLHITDLHPDSHYEPGTSTSKACHRKKSKKKKNIAGYYGTPYSECDSPFRLTDYTFDFLDKKWAQEVDFVIWTGDNARHDNDPKIPRTTKEIYDLNRAVARKMSEVFTSRGIPVIPSLGNNDIWPHNILAPGPNSITNEFSQIWQSFIPFPYRQVFQRGAYFATEVVPNALAVISLNTLYFYDSNKAVGGCSYKEPEDPGNLEFDWLEVQLKIFRDRGMQVWLTGHVPPSSSNYFPECYVRYVDLALRFQDTVLGHLFGHMNMDHFFFVEAVDLEFDDDNDNSASHHNQLFDWLLQDFARLPKSQNTDLDEYAVINVSPSVVPNPYLPSLRIFTYNITGAEDALTGSSAQQTKKMEPLKERLPGHHRGEHRNKDHLCKEDRYRDTWKCKLRFNPPSDPNAPSRSATLWTPLGYSQYFIPSLDEKRPRFKLEYTTFPATMLLPGEGSNETEFRYPIPLENLPKSIRNGKMKNKFFAFDMKDLTVGSWMDLARRLGDVKESRLRKKFKKFIYLGKEKE